MPIYFAHQVFSPLNGVIYNIYFIDPSLPTPKTQIIPTFSSELGQFLVATRCLSQERLDPTQNFALWCTNPFQDKKKIAPMHVHQFLYFKSTDQKRYLLYIPNKVSQFFIQSTLLYQDRPYTKIPLSVYYT